MKVDVYEWTSPVPPRLVAVRVDEFITREQAERIKSNVRNSIAEAYGPSPEVGVIVMCRMDPTFVSATPEVNEIGARIIELHQAIKALEATIAPQSRSIETDPL